MSKTVRIGPIWKKRRISAAVALAFALVAGASMLGVTAAEAKRPRYYYAYECHTGWWMVRDGHPLYRPSDGMWRPAWSTRCFKVRRVQYTR